MSSAPPKPTGWPDEGAHTIQKTLQKGRDLGERVQYIEEVVSDAPTRDERKGKQPCKMARHGQGPWHWQQNSATSIRK